MIDAETLQLMKLNLRADCQQIMSGYSPPAEPRENPIVLAGRRMADLRRAKGLSQEALAKISGYARPLVSAFECAYRIPNAAQRRDIAQALGVEVADIWR